MRSGPMPSETFPVQVSRSRKARGVLRRLAIWRRKQGSLHGVGTLQLLAILGLVLPLLVAVATQYSAQAIPDFDDYDWDGPDDDDWDDKGSHSVWMPHDGGHSHGTVGALSPLWSCASLFDPQSSETRMEDRHPQMLSVLHRDPAGSRGPPPSSRGAASAARSCSVVS